jgi:hypothetical protein
LESQADLIVKSIQSLLLVLRDTQAPQSELDDAIYDITHIVEDVTQTTAKAFESQPNLQSKGRAILDSLQEANIKIENLGSAMAQSSSSKQIKQKLATSSYEIAKHIKELISITG